MDLLLQRSFDGMFNGAIYTTLAIALVAIYRSTGLLNFAQGEMAMVSGYIGLVLMTAPGALSFGSRLAGTELASNLPWHPWPVPAAIAAAVLFGALLGVVIERLAMRPLRGHTEFSQINISIGLLILINGFTVLTWGTNSRAFPSPFPNASDDFVSVGGARLRFTTIGVWAVLWVTIVLLGVLVKKTKTGLAFRGITSNPEAAALVGVPINRTTSIGWAVASGIGALAACLVGGALIIEPFLMMKLLIFGFAAATIGGLDSPGGAIAGGMIVGMSQSLLPGYLPIPTELSLLPPIAAMTIILLVRPQGLFGTRAISRV